MDAHIQSALAGFARRTPGLQYVAVTADRVLADLAIGSADLARGIALTPATTEMAYSMSKTVTAIAVLQLVEQGRVGLDDPVARYVEAQPYGSAVTVRQLLSHTGGLPNPIPLRWVHTDDAHAGFDEARALRSVLDAHPRLASRPGARYRYSNIGYWLLGSVVARAAGKPFIACVRDDVLAPLGIPPGELGYAIERPAAHATGYLEKYSLINLAKGLLIDRALIGEYAGSWLEIRRHYLNGPAFGGLVGTARAFGRLLQDQLAPASVLLGDEARRHLYTAQRTNDGREVPMTLGWHVGALNGIPTYYKEGGGGGFHCLMRVYPSTGIGTVVMANATGVDVKGVLDAVDPIVGATKER